MADPVSPTGAELRVEVIVDDQQTDVEIDACRWAALARAALQSERAAGELTLTFVDRAEMTELNREHMGGDGPTDVLSFPLDDEPLADVPTLLGDVVISPTVGALPSDASTAARARGCAWPRSHPVRRGRIP